MNFDRSPAPQDQPVASRSNPTAHQPALAQQDKSGPPQPLVIRCRAMRLLAAAELVCLGAELYPLTMLSSSFAAPLDDCRAEQRMNVHVCTVAYIEHRDREHDHR